MTHPREKWVGSLLLVLMAGGVSGCPFAVSDNYTLEPEGQGGAASRGCVNGERTGDETDVDCGGGDCEPCPAGLTCEESSDCESSICTDRTCVAATCDDEVRNGEETDLDCGGPDCPWCLVGQGCEVNSDCATELCDSGECVAP